MTEFHHEDGHACDDPNCIGEMSVDSAMEMMEAGLVGTPIEAMGLVVLSASAWDNDGANYHERMILNYFGREILPPGAKDADGTMVTMGSLVFDEDSTRGLYATLTNFIQSMISDGKWGNNPPAAHN